MTWRPCTSTDVTGATPCWTCALDYSWKFACSGSSKVNNSLPVRHCFFLTFGLQPPTHQWLLLSFSAARAIFVAYHLLSVRLLLQSPSAYKMPRLVRRRPLWERITSNLNPMDFLLWLSEELETRDWDSKLVGTQLGLTMNLVFLLARANAGATSSSDNDLFGDETKIGWFSYVVSTSST